MKCKHDILQKKQSMSIVQFLVFDYKSKHLQVLIATVTSAAMKNFSYCFSKRMQISLVSIAFLRLFQENAKYFGEPRAPKRSCLAGEKRYSGTAPGPSKKIKIRTFIFSDKYSLQTFQTKGSQARRCARCPVRGIHCRGPEIQNISIDQQKKQISMISDLG